MHPEVTSDDPGSCPKCGMKLVKKTESAAKEQDSVDLGLGKLTLRNYLPLLVVIGLIFFTSLAITLNNLNFQNFLENFTIGFFLVFGGFKLLDLAGFAEGYRMYDLLAMRLPLYGYVYPFIELFFAFAMLLNFAPKQILWAEIVVMIFSGLGVLIKILKKERFKCVCLGTTLKVPLTTMTLIEDFGMAAFAGILLYLA
jgi:hypothetical protein